MLAEITALLLARGMDNLLPWLTERKGLYPPRGSWIRQPFGMGERNLEAGPESTRAGLKELMSAATADFPTSAKRPLFSVLDCEKFADL